MTAVRFAGAGYLVFLGIRALWAARRPATEAPAPAPGSWFLQGLGTNLLNPKAVLFFAAVLPQFLGDGAPVPQIVLLGAADVALGIAVWAALVVAAARLREPLSRPRVRQWWERTTGLTFVGLGTVPAKSQ